jgi:predicted amidohydrolase
MKIAILQLSFGDEESKSTRIARVEEIIAEAQPTDLVLLPEVWNIGYYSFDRYMSESETLEGETVSRLSAMAKKYSTYIFSGSFIEREGDKLYNSAVLLDPQGDICGSYRKIHLFGLGSDERKVLSAGDKISVIDTKFGKIGLSICYDLRFPELHRRMSAQGAEIILSCAAWGYPRVENWLILNRARAIENQCYYLTCGCAGTSFGKSYIGRSQAIDPWGNVVASAGEQETILKFEINPKQVANARQQLSFLRDRVLND